MAPVTSFYKLEAKNRRESVLLVLFAIFILVLLGTLIGTAMAGDLVGALPVIIFAGLLGFGSVAGSYYVGD